MGDPVFIGTEKLGQKAGDMWEESSVIVAGSLYM